MNPKRLSRRSFIQWSALFVGAGTLAACAPQATEAPKATGQPAEAPTQKPAGTTAQEATPAPKEITVRWMSAWGTNFTKPVEELLKTPEWKEICAGITFDYNAASDNERILVAIASGDPPDGISCLSDYSGFMVRGVLRPLGEMLDSSTRVHRDDLVEAALPPMTWKGELYGLPAIEYFCRFGLNYNKQLVEAAGLDPKSPPRTWGEHLAWAEKLTKKDKGGNLLQVGFDPFDGMGSTMMHPELSWGFEFLDRKTRKLKINRPEMVEYLKLCTQFYDLAGPDNLATFHSANGSWIQSYASGLTATLVNGGWHPGELANANPETSKQNISTWIPMSDTRRDVKVQCYYGNYICIPLHARQPEGMWRVAEALMTDASADLFFKFDGWMCPRKSWLAKVDASIYPGLPWYVDSISQADELRPWEWNPIETFMRSKFDTLKEQVVRKEITPEQCLEETERLTQEEFDKQFADLPLE